VVDALWVSPVQVDDGGIGSTFTRLFQMSWLPLPTDSVLLLSGKTPLSASPDNVHQTGVSLRGRLESRSWAPGPSRSSELEERPGHRPDPRFFALQRCERARPPAASSDVRSRVWRHGMGRPGGRSSHPVVFGFWSQTEPAGYIHLVAARKGSSGHWHRSLAI
jgi:hypothetical protein